jgi:hypothetical protein
VLADGGMKLELLNNLSEMEFVEFIVETLGHYWHSFHLGINQKNYSYCFGYSHSSKCEDSGMMICFRFVESDCDCANIQVEGSNGSG